MQNKKKTAFQFYFPRLFYFKNKNLISLLLEKGYRLLIKMNKNHAGVPVLLYEITTTYCSSYLSLNGNLYVLNVRVLVRALMTQEIMRSR